MSLFSAAFLAEAQKRHPEIYPVLTIALPSGTRRYAKEGLAIEAVGYAEPLIQQWGSINRSIDLRGSNLQTIQVSPTLGDSGRVFSAEVSRYRRSLHRVAATIDLVSPNVDHADRFVAFSGILDSWTEVRPLVWQLNLGTDDTWLQFGQLPKATINPIDWPDADPEVYGTFIPIIYGTHNSDGITDAGMVPTYQVDTSNRVYLVALGTIHEITAVYADGTLLSTSDWARADTTVNGKRLTVITFSSPPSADAVVTADVKGLTSDYTGGGDFLLNPAEQFEHALHNFGYADWRSGPYLTGAPLNSTSFATVASFLDDMGHEGSMWIGGDSQTTVLDFVQRFLESHEVKAYWTNAGQLALGVNDHRTTNIYGATHWTADIDESRAAELSVPYMTQDLTRELIISYVFGQVSGKYHQTVRVQDLGVSDPVSKGRELPWSAARVL